MRRALALLCIGAASLALAALTAPDEHEVRDARIAEMEMRTQRLARMLSDVQYAVEYRQQMRRAWYAGSAR